MKVNLMTVELSENEEMRGEPKLVDTLLIV